MHTLAHEPTSGAGGGGELERRSRGRGYGRCKRPLAVCISILTDKLKREALRAFEDQASVSSLRTERRRREYSLIHGIDQNRTASRQSERQPPPPLTQPSPHLSSSGQQPDTFSPPSQTCPYPSPGHRATRRSWQRKSRRTSEGGCETPTNAPLYPLVLFLKE